MIVLGFDTATHATAVGLRLPDGSTLHARDDPAPDGHPGHATRLLALAAELLERAELRWSAVQRIAVGVGPGRFTGLRVGIATARGLAQSLSAELVGVSSLHALALPAIRAVEGLEPQVSRNPQVSRGSQVSRSSQVSRGSQDTEPVGAATIAVIDARRREAFAGAFAGEREFVLPRPLRPAELERVVARLHDQGAPSAARWRAVGDGALLYAEQLRAGGVEVPEPRSPLHLLDGAAVCTLGALPEPAPAGPAALAAILPDYRRSPDAALARNQRPPAVGVSRA